MLDSRPQRWRALVQYRDGTEGLLYLGASLLQVREGYKEPWAELLTEDERANVHQILLQRWQGPLDRGRWEKHGILSVPAIVA